MIQTTKCYHRVADVEKHYSSMRSISWLTGLALIATIVAPAHDVILSQSRSSNPSEVKLGATPAVIRTQFLLEAIALSVVGGLLGIGVGWLGAVVLPKLIDQPVTLSAWASAGALVVAIGVGIVAGVYPAGRAARLAPIDALRSE